MKSTLFVSALAVLFVSDLAGQPAPSAPAPGAPALTNREAEMRRILERAYRNLDGTTGALRTTLPAPTNTPSVGDAPPPGDPAKPAVPPTPPANPPAAGVRSSPAATGVSNAALARPGTIPLGASAATSNVPGLVGPAGAPPASATERSGTAATARTGADTNATARPAVRPRPGLPFPTPPAPAAATAGTTSPTNVVAARTNRLAQGLAKAAEKLAADQPEEEQVIKPGEIKFQDTDLAQVLEIYQDLTGRTVLRPATLPQVKITIKTQTELTRKEAIQALDSILSMNGITMTLQADKFVKAVQTGEANQAAMMFYNADPEDLPEAGQYVCYIAKLKYVDPTELTQALQPFGSKAPQSILAIKSTQTLVLRDYSENVKRMLELIKEIDVYVPANVKPVVIPIKYALASDIATVIGSLTAGGGGVTSVGQNRVQGQRFTTAGGGGSGSISGMGMGSGGYGGGGYGGSSGMYGGGVRPYSTTTAALGTGMGTSGSGYGGQRSSFSSRLGAIVNRAVQGAGDIVVLGETKIIADERTNSLLIFASDEDIKMIKEIISKLDVVLAQVLIEAIILEVNLDDDFKFGVSVVQGTKDSGKWSGLGGWNNLPGFFGGATNALTPIVRPPDAQGKLPGGFTYYAQYQDDIGILVQAFASDNRVKVLSRPKIQTSHAVPCRIFIGETRPYPTGSSYGGVYGGGYNQIAQLRIGIELNVLPLINPDGLVVMDIDQRIDSSDSTVLLQNVGEVPITKERSANAKVSVRDGETIVLGGFIGSTKSSGKSGVPYLKDIPLLGYLFTSTSDKKSRREIIVLIRPTVLPSPEDAALVAAEQRSMLPGIKQADAEFEQMEQKLLKKSNRNLYKREDLPK